MNPDGSGVHKVSGIRLRDSWKGTRDQGQELILNPHASVDSAFLIVNRRGELLQRIETGLPMSSDPTFNNEGTMIAFRGGTEESKRVKGYKEDIYLLRSDGTGMRQLSHYPASDTTAPWYAYKAGPPKWHPTEGYITFQSFRNHSYKLYAVDTVGREWRLIEPDTGWEEGWHDWSPDGKWLAIELFDPDQTQFHIGLMNWESKELKILTDSSFVYQQARCL